MQHNFDFGTAMRVLRAEKKLTQKNVAMQAKCDPSTICLLEGGKRLPSLHLLNVFAEVFDRSPSEIVRLAEQYGKKTRANHE